MLARMFFQLSDKALVFNEALRNSRPLFEISVEFGARKGETVLDVVGKTMKGAVGGLLLRRVTRGSIMNGYVGQNHLNGGKQCVRTFGT